MRGAAVLAHRLERLAVQIQDAGQVRRVGESSLLHLAVEALGCKRGLLARGKLLNKPLVQCKELVASWHHRRHWRPLGRVEEAHHIVAEPKCRAKYWLINVGDRRLEEWPTTVVIPPACTQRGRAAGQQGSEENRG